VAYIKGNIKQIIYKTEKGFIVGLFKVIDSDEADRYINKTITFTGTFPELKMDVDYILYGDLVEHPKYGEQFSVSSYEQIMPKSINGIISFLSSKLFPGIGVKQATKIVEVLGDKTLDLIIEDHNNLLIVPKMTEKKALKIKKILERERTSYKIIVELQNMGFSMNDASKIYNYYKESTTIIIEDNIYSITSDIDGIGFLTVDKIASKKGILFDDERRIMSCIIYIMNELCWSNGHIYNDFKDIYNNVVKYLSFGLKNEDFNYFLLKLNKEGKIIIEEDRYYLRDYYMSEVYNATFINNLINIDDHNYNNLDKHIKKLEKEYKLTYNEEQLSAIKSSFLKNFLVVTGGPGTGKTTIIKAMAELYLNLNNLTATTDQMTLLAPTGRAAKRITEATGINAMTIHKFLKWNKETNEFKVNENNKSSVKFVIVDEVSMIDNFLLYNLFKGLSNNVKMILVGDHNQLPSVGPGQILKDLIESENVPVIKLSNLYRQKEDSYIVTLAHNINEGIIPPELTLKKEDYNFIRVRKSDICDAVLMLCQKALEKGYSYKEIQVLIPMYKGVNGIDAMNIMLQDVFNPVNDKNNTFTHNNVTYRVGDKVLQIKNNNDLNISNGDIGTIENIVYKNNEYIIYIDFNDEIYEYSAKDFDDIRLGYAISIHKSQGSEFDIVILPMDLSYNRMLYRKLIYTAVTRAKRSLMVVGEIEALNKAIINEREEIRKTSLKHYLKVTENV